MEEEPPQIPITPSEETVDRVGSYDRLSDRAYLQKLLESKPEVRAFMETLLASGTSDPDVDIESIVEAIPLDTTSSPDDPRVNTIEGNPKLREDFDELAVALLSKDDVKAFKRPVNKNISALLKEYPTPAALEKALTEKAKDSLEYGSTFFAGMTSTTIARLEPLSAVLYKERFEAEQILWKLLSETKIAG